METTINILFRYRTISNVFLMYNTNMLFKKAFKQVPMVVSTYHKYLYLRSVIALLGIFPVHIKRIMLIKRYLGERYTFQKMGGLVSLIAPITDEYGELAGTARGHYFHQDLLVAQFIYKANPRRHIDVGSRIDGFVAHVASFRKIEIYDIRALNNCGYSNIEFKQADLMLRSNSNVTDSLSCLHAIEHFGLGRYGDSINPNGHIEGLHSLIEMLQPGGILYISFPIGKTNQVHFNAQRVFHPKDIISWVPDRLTLIRFDYVDDNGEIQKNFDLLNSELVVTYGCGIYTFRKI
jgi:hypothetical protein